MVLIRFVNVCLKSIVVPQFVKEIDKFNDNRIQQKAAKENVLDVEHEKRI